MENEEKNFSAEEHEYSEENEEIEEFESQLGKKEYWDNFYKKEINQFNNNSDLIGEIWFGQQVQKKVLNYICNDTKLKQNNNIKVLDVGCGNAAFLISLYDEGYRNLFGMDYSENSIELAKNILNHKYGNEIFSSIRLYPEDINSPLITNKDFELIHDKGTFDAFMLFKENNEKSYINYILQKSNSDGTIFIITSCNHSFSELKNFFMFEGSKFYLICDIPHKTFNFGGQQGQTVTTLVFSIN